MPTAKHHHIHPVGTHILTYLGSGGDDEVGDEETRGGAHGGDGVAEDAEGEGVVVVVEDAAEVVDVCVWGY
ncbi:hypothetical protein HYALB_00004497 [Hymenoscyphus albidus]|uniref:Uncharacterized protein n=1 Tax=Hymenoscyphus albidus TaxID=595503 RepID=A0A9N9LYP7_9HELO|nr:hypothetical protein HYALB_00004497 [Hymenoscyphus albidus]